jgi:hypothetical protein
MPLIPALLLLASAFGINHVMPEKHKLFEIGVYVCGATSDKSNDTKCGEFLLSGGTNDSSKKH